mgnify:CR=1 FL=1
MTLTSERGDVPVERHPELGDWGDLVKREARAQILPGTPVLWRTDGWLDPRLVEYFNRSLEFVGLAETSKATYAIEMRLWFEYLQTQGLSWDEASEDDLVGYQIWRLRSDENPRPVSPATWRKSAAALHRFYGWAAEKGREYVPANPVPTVAGGRAIASPKDARTSRDKWVTPGVYTMWRQVGLEGYSAAVDERTGVVVATTPSPSSRGRNRLRDVAFTDLMFGAALRRVEISSLLHEEVPDSWVDEAILPGAIAKGGRPRAWGTWNPEALGAVDRYVRFGRQGAIRRAQRERRYDDLPDLLVAESIENDGRDGVVAVLADGSRRRIDRLGPEERSVLFRRTGEGLEPMMLWLTDAGLPMKARSWNAVFDRANDRVASAYAQLGRRGRPPRLTPHSLRFTCALFVLLAYARVIDQRLGVDPAERWDESRYDDAFSYVQDLLGHATVDVTRDIYLKPLRDLRRTSLFREHTDETSVLDLLVARSTLVFDPREPAG